MIGYDSDILVLREEEDDDDGSVLFVVPAFAVVVVVDVYLVAPRSVLVGRSEGRGRKPMCITIPTSLVLYVPTLVCCCLDV